ncbi:MAG TPA: arginine--tRNA ligase [Spirochaetota bacterium]|nr:arginine--tRNA ligase [Spirochaetota bacterium]
MILEMIDRIASVLPGITSLGEDAVRSAITRPPKPEMGDLAFPCFPLAKVRGKAPQVIAAELVPEAAAALAGSGIIVESAGPYLNFRFDRKKVAAGIAARAMSGTPLVDDCGRGRTLVIDFSSPNIAKPFSMGHLRSTSIGNALSRIYAALGWKVVRINHLGDWGTQFGKLICAFRLWGERERLEREDIAYLMELYIRFNDAAKADPALDDAARAAFKELEDGGAEAHELWQVFRDASLREFERIYGILDVSFDSFAGESFYNDKVDGAVQTIMDAGLASTSEGALVVEMDEGSKEPPCMIRKSDGATTYAARDLAALFYRQKEYAFDRLLYVVGAPQSLHFRQVFTVLRKLGLAWHERCQHIPFGQVLLEGEMMSTRRGNVIFLEDVIKEAESRALEKMLANAVSDDESGSEDSTASVDISQATDEQRARARILAVSSIIFFDLKNGRIKDVDFSWDEILNPHGETGIYLQYAHARIHGIMRKFEDRTGLSIDEIRQTVPVITEDTSWPIFDAISLLPDKAAYAAENNEPSVIARWLLDLASAFSTYYRANKVINEDNPALSRERMAVVLSVREALAQGLQLLGIRPLDRM